jgi:O-antigen ligase
MPRDAHLATAVERARRGDGWLIAFVGFTAFTLFAGDFWRNLIGWAGWGVLVGLLLVGNVAWLLVRRPHVRFRKWPKALLLFLLLAAVSIAWSAYAAVSALAVVATLATTVAGLVTGLCLTWAQLLRALGAALRWVIGLSLLFELFVSVFVRHPIVPFWTDYGSGKLPQAFYWSRDLLFHGGQIQGIVGNSNLLAMNALLALIVFGIQLADRRVHRVAGIVWLALAGLTFVLTRSSTVIVATLVVAIVLLFALWTRRAGEARRLAVYGTALALAAVGAASIIVLWGPFVRLFGKSEDLTGRLDIWQKVIGLAIQRPIAGWGWVSYWVPWVKPFKGLAERKGVEYLQAHNAWLDVWLQLGIIGLVILICLVVTTFGRAWIAAVDRPRFGIADTAPYSALTLLPLLVLAALIAQSAAESRLLVESGWMLLVAFCVRTKADRP